MCAFHQLLSTCALEPTKNEIKKNSLVLPVLCASNLLQYLMVYYDKWFLFDTETLHFKLS